MSTHEATPVAARTPLWAGLAAGAAAGELHLQTCGQCGTVQYPPRELCRACLADALAWQRVDGAGEVIDAVAVHASLEPWYRERLPWWIGKIRLGGAVKLIAHLDEAVRTPGAPVQVHACIDISGSAVLLALPPAATVPAAAGLRELLGLNGPAPEQQT
jgi:uncharacterized OB-fold protein